jgi:hypothetical protein
MQDHGKKIFLISIGVVVAVILAFFGYQGYKAKMEEKRHAEIHQSGHSTAVEYIKAGKWDYASYTLEPLDEDRCVDCDTFLLYAYAMIKYKNGQADNAGIESAHDWFEQISTDYSGELADDIRRDRERVNDDYEKMKARQAEAKRQEEAAQAARKAAEEAERANNVYIGDSEEKVRRLFGTPDHVGRAVVGDTETKQFVYYAPGRNIIIYLQNGKVAGFMD